MTDNSHLPQPSSVMPSKLPDLTQADYDRFAFKEARLERHMTQEQFGAALGITASLVTKIERGERAVSDQVMHDLRKLAKPASDTGTRVKAGEEWPLIQRLRDEEADSVTILCDNPDGPPNAAIECCGFWTGFAERRFEGDTVLDALKAAVAAKDEATYDFDTPTGEDLKAPEPTGYPHSAISLQDATKSADDVRQYVRAWLDADDPTHWGSFEKALDSAVEGKNERDAIVTMLRADAGTMRQNAMAYSEEAPTDARALHEVATTLAFKAAQIERGDHLEGINTPTASLATATGGVRDHAGSVREAEVAKIIRYVDGVIEQADRSKNTSGLWLFADGWRTVRAALAALHPVDSRAQGGEG